MCLLAAPLKTDADLLENIREACQAYSNAAREGIAHRWWKIDPPDYACGGVEVSADDIAGPISSDEAFIEWAAPRGWTIQTQHRIAYSITRETAAPDLMAAVRDIARGS